LDERRPYGAWAASATLHGAILALVLVGFASAPKFDDSEESIPVETVSAAELNRIMNGEKHALPAPPPRPAPEVATSPAPPTPPPPDLRASIEPAPTPPPKPEPAPKAEPPPKPAPAPKPLAEDAPEPPIRPKTEPERPKPSVEKPKQDLIAKVVEREKAEPEPRKTTRAYDPAAIAKLIGETKPSSAASSAAAATPQGLPRHNAPRMSVSMAAALDAWLTESYLNCWTPPPAMPGGDVYVAEIKVMFNVDGSLSTRPVLLNPPTDPAWRAHADSAMRAVKKCDPLRVPPEYIPYFEQWKVETIHFDPRETQG